MTASGTGLPNDRPGRRRLGMLLAGAAVWALAAGARGEAPTPEAAPASTQPTTGRISLLRPDDPPPAPLPVTTAATVKEALDYSPAEKTILDDVADRDGQLDAAALYVLLRRAAMLPTGPATMEQAEQPNPASLWTEPERYRGRLVRLVGYYAGRTQDWSENVAPTRWWGGRKVYMVDLEVRPVGEKRPRAVLVALARKPHEFAKGARVEVAGIFYKLSVFRSQADADKTGARDEYPVIVAGEIGRLRPAEGAGGAGLPAPLVVMFVVILAMLLGFAMLKRRIDQIHRRGQSKYRPQRFEDAADEAEQRRAEEAGPIDPELLRQVAEYKAEHDQPPKGPHNDGDNAHDSR